MKILLISLTCITIMVSCSSRYGAENTNYASSAVVVTLNDNNDQVYIDGQNLGNNRYNNTLQLNNVQPGRHTIDVVRSRGILGSIFGSNNNSTRTAFDVRYGYDTQLYVRSNGKVQVRQTRSVAYQNNNRRYNRYDREDRDRDRDRDRDY